jgi:hypothetical protein
VIKPSVIGFTLVLVSIGAVTPANDWLTIADRPSPCVTCIGLRTIAVIGDSGGPGELEDTKSIVEDSLGRFWVGQPGHLKVFAADGRYLRAVGRRGEGPLEFNVAKPLFVDATGRIVVGDRSNRITLVRPDFEYDSSFNPPNAYVAAVGLGPNEMLVHAWIGSNTSIGSPLHIVRNGDVTRSFGVLAEERGTPIDQFQSQRVFGLFPDGRIVTARIYAYDIGIWTRDGKSELGALRGPRINTAEVKPGGFAPDNPIPHQITAVTGLDTLHLVVGFARRRDDWERFVEMVPRPGGGAAMRFRTGIGVGDILSGRLDVIDVGAHRIVARLDTPDILIRFLGPHRAVFQRYLKDGTMQLVVAEVTLIGR